MSTVEFPETRWPIEAGNEFSRLCWDDLRKAVYRRYYGTGSSNWPFASYTYSDFDYFTVDGYYDREDYHGVAGDYFSGMHPWRDSLFSARLYAAYIAGGGDPEDWAALNHYGYGYIANYPNNEGDLTPYNREGAKPGEVWIYIGIQNHEEDPEFNWQVDPIWVPAWVFLPYQVKYYATTSNCPHPANERRRELNWWMHRKGWDTLKYARLNPGWNNIYAHIAGNKYHVDNAMHSHVDNDWQSEFHQMQSSIEHLAVKVGWRDYCLNSWRGHVPAWVEVGATGVDVSGFTEAQYWAEREGWLRVGEIVRRRWPNKTYSDNCPSYMLITCTGFTYNDAENEVQPLEGSEHIVGTHIVPLDVVGDVPQDEDPYAWDLYLDGGDVRIYLKVSSTIANAKVSYKTNEYFNRSDAGQSLYCSGSLYKPPGAPYNECTVTWTPCAADGQATSCRLVTEAEYETVPTSVNVWNAVEEKFIETDTMAAVDWFLWSAEEADMEIDYWLDTYQIDHSPAVYKTYIRPKFKEYGSNVNWEMCYKVMNDYKQILQSMQYTAADPWLLYGYFTHAIWDGPSCTGLIPGWYQAAFNHMIANFESMNSYTQQHTPPHYLYQWRWAGDIVGHSSIILGTGRVAVDKDVREQSGYHARFLIAQEPIDLSEPTAIWNIDSDVLAQGSVITKHIRVKNIHGSSSFNFCKQAHIECITPTREGVDWGGIFVGGWNCGATAPSNLGHTIVFSNGSLDVTGVNWWNHSAFVISHMETSHLNYSSRFTISWHNGAWEHDFSKIEIPDEQ